MTDLTTVHLVRHGEVDNPTGILYGRQPGFHLTRLGREMAAGLGEAFADRDVRAVITSPLERARETGLPTARRFSLSAQTDPALIEADNKFEGIAVNDSRWVLLNPKFIPLYANPFRPSWGEPYTQIVTRMSAAVRRALTAARGGEAVLVSHQLPIWVFRRFVEGKHPAHDPRKRQCALASVTSFCFTGDVLTSWNYWEPVGDLLREAGDMVPGTSAAKTKKSGIQP